MPQVYQEALHQRATAPYLTRMMPGGAVSKLRFCPYEVRSLPLTAGCSAAPRHAEAPASSSPWNGQLPACLAPAHTLGSQGWQRIPAAHGVCQGCPDTWLAAASSLHITSTEDSLLGSSLDTAHLKQAPRSPC